MWNLSCWTTRKVPPSNFFNSPCPHGSISSTSPKPVESEGRGGRKTGSSISSLSHPERKAHSLSPPALGGVRAVPALRVTAFQEPDETRWRSASEPGSLAPTAQCGSALCESGLPELPCANMAEDCSHGTCVPRHGKACQAGRRVLELLDNGGPGKLGMKLEGRNLGQRSWGLPPLLRTVPTVAPIAQVP